MERIKFLSLFGPDTKNSYGIMSQLYKNFDKDEHRFLILAHKDSMNRFPKLYKFDNLLFIPNKGTKISKIIYLYKLLKNSEHIIIHSMFFTSKKYLWFFYFFRKLLKKAVWIEWGADLYLWEVENNNFKNRIKNYLGRKIRNSFGNVGCIFPVDKKIFRKEFNNKAKVFYTPMPNPIESATGLMDKIDSLRPKSEESESPIRIQIAHNSFTFNNHVKLLNYVSQYKGNNIKCYMPVSYGVYGINGSYGGKDYVKCMVKYAKQLYGNKIVIMDKPIRFDNYLRYLWKIDIAVFDFDRPCGLGNIRMMLYMGKKVFLPGGSDFYNFFIEKGIKVYDTNKIPEMSYEEFVEPVKDTDLSWIREYLNNDITINYWKKMFEELEKNEQR